MRPVEPSVEWEELPAGLRTEIESRTGPVLDASAAGEGLSTSFRLILHTAREDVFVKGTGPDSTKYQRRRLATGADLARRVAVVSPPLLWFTSWDSWLVTGWPALPGRPWADQKPDSADIPKMVRLLDKLASVPAPDLLRRTAREQWEGYADNPDLLDGDFIVHRDPNPTNFVVDGDRAWMVDFGWSVRGPAWMTAANLAVSMMEAGWEAPDADRALWGVRAWHQAPSAAVAEYSQAVVREWQHVMASGPVHEVWELRAAAARTWADYWTAPGQRYSA